MDEKLETNIDVDFHWKEIDHFTSMCGGTISREICVTLLVFVRASSTTEAAAVKKEAAIELQSEGLWKALANFRGSPNSSLLNRRRL